MVERVEEQNRNVRLHLAQHVRQHDALGLKTRRDAGRLCRGRALVVMTSSRIDESDHVSISSSALRMASAAS